MPRQRHLRHSGYSLAAAALAFLLVHGPAWGQQAAPRIDCRNPPNSVPFVQILPCVEKKMVKVELSTGKRFSGKLKRIPEEACATDEECKVRIDRRWFRDEIVGPGDLVSIGYRVPATRKRALIGWLAGTATVVGATSAFLGEDAYGKEGAWALGLPFTVPIGIGIGHGVGRGRMVTVQIDHKPPVSGSRAE